jgi:hypothetical protein
LLRYPQQWPRKQTSSSGYCSKLAKAVLVKTESGVLIQPIPIRDLRIPAHRDSPITAPAGIGRSSRQIAK